MHHPARNNNSLIADDEDAFAAEFNEFGIEREMKVSVDTSRSDVGFDNKILVIPPRQTISNCSVAIQ